MAVYLVIVAVALLVATTTVCVEVYDAFNDL
jgi:hypothetical protein